MPWPPPTDVLLASGAGAAVLLVLAALVLLVVRRRRARRDAVDRPTVAHAVAAGLVSPSGAPEATPAEPAEAAPPPVPDSRIGGSGAPLAAALARALTVRPAPRGDVRDRLLAVLLDDPVRAVGAAAAVDHERGVLGAHLAQLAAAGLQPEQLAALAGRPADEIRDLLATTGG